MCQSSELNGKLRRVSLSSTVSHTSSPGLLVACLKEFIAETDPSVSYFRLLSQGALVIHGTGSGDMHASPFL